MATPPPTYETTASPDANLLNADQTTHPWPTPTALLPSYFTSSRSCWMTEEESLEMADSDLNVGDDAENTTSLSSSVVDPEVDDLDVGDDAESITSLSSSVVDPEVDDLDVGDDAESTTSLSSSVVNPEEENGRTYHSYKPGKHPLPNDEMEKDRLDLQHHLFGLTFGGKLFTCPVDTKKYFHRVLDAGTGTGIWAIDFADKYSHSCVTGTDLSPMQPSWVPSNVKFEVDDLEEDWTFKSQFGFIYCRMLTFSISDWDHFFRQSLKNLEPGGYIEVVDIAFPIEAEDDSLSADSLLKEWSCSMLEASKKAGKSIDNAKFHKQRLEKAGFENVVEVKHYWPQNSWAKHQYYKQLGMWNHANMETGIEGMSMALFTRQLKWTPEEVQVYLCGVRREMGDKNIHAFWPIYVVHGQKPNSPRV